MGRLIHEASSAPLRQQSASAHSPLALARRIADLGRKRMILFLSLLRCCPNAKWPGPVYGMFDLFEHHHSSGAAPDPHLDAFAVMLTVVVLAAFAVLCVFTVLLLCVPVFSLRVRRIRDLFWVIPAANLALYFLSIAVQAYPGGFAARFRPPGVWYTLTEVGIVVVLSLVTATLMAVATWLVRKIRGRPAEPKKEEEPAPSPPPIPPRREG